MKNKYTSKSIKVLEGLKGIRKRPAMYIGNTGISGFHHLLWEIISNSLDELINGFGNEILIKLKKNNLIIVEDNGRGIPIDKNPKYKRPAINLIFEKLHSGAKFNDESYKNSGGLHGVGASVVNALSKYLFITVYKNGWKYILEYSNGGKLVQSLKKGR